MTYIVIYLCFFFFYSSVTLLILIDQPQNSKTPEREWEMSLGDLRIRVDAICKKYDRYDVDKHKDSNNFPLDDVFARLYAAVQADVDTAFQVAYSFSLINFLTSFFLVLWTRYIIIYVVVSLCLPDSEGKITEIKKKGIRINFKVRRMYF